VTRDQLPHLLQAPSSRRMNVAVGVALLLLGLCLGAVDGFFLTKILFMNVKVEVGAWVVVVILTCIVAFCISTGVRLVWGRPNRYGSLLSPWTCYALAAVFLAFAIVAAVTLISQGSYLKLNVVPIVLLLSLLCFGAGRHIHMKKKPTHAP
jgi:hypothetical protein